MTTPYSSYSTSGQSAYPASQSTPTSTAHFTSVLSSASFADQTPATPGTPTPVGRGRPRGSVTGAKRGRKPRGALAAGAAASASPRPFATPTFGSTNSTAGPTSTPASFGTPVSSSSNTGPYGKVHWAMPGSEDSTAGGGTALSGATTDGGVASGSTSVNADGTSLGTTGSLRDASVAQDASSSNVGGASSMVIDPALMGPGGTITGAMNGTQRGTPGPEGTAVAATANLLMAGRGLSQLSGPGRLGTAVPGLEEEGEGDDELLPAMADDDYSAQLSWQSQSKDNLKVLMDNLSPAQYDRFEAYRRHALPKQAVRKVIQQTLGQQVSQPVAQIIAGFSKVFVGEMVEKARAVQARRGETGPLSPDHLREAYRMYQQETGHVGAARPLRAKKLFVR